MVARRGFEPLIPWLRTTYPRPLDERAAHCVLGLYHGSARVSTFTMPCSRMALSSAKLPRLTSPALRLVGGIRGRL